MKQNNWKTANKSEVKNKELWLDLYECINYHNVDWEVKGAVVIFLMKRLTKLHEKRQRKL